MPCGAAVDISNVEIIWIFAYWTGHRNGFLATVAAAEAFRARVANLYAEVILATAVILTA